MRLTATRRIFAYSGRVPAADCIAAIGVLGGRGPCQSQSQTVPKEPSPTALMGVKERLEAVCSVMRRRINYQRGGIENRQVWAFPYRTPVEVNSTAGIACDVKDSLGAGRGDGR